MRGRSITILCFSEKNLYKIILVRKLKKKKVGNLVIKKNTKQNQYQASAVVDSYLTIIRRRRGEHW